MPITQNVAFGPQSLLRLLVNLAFVLSLFPFFGILPVSAEIQPLAAIPAIAALLLCQVPVPKFGWVYLLTVTAFTFPTLMAGLYGSEPSPMAVMETYLAILAPVVIVLALRGNLHLVSPRAVVISIMTWIGVGLSQEFWPDFQTVTGLNVILSALINRYSTIALSEWDRGITMLAPEPSYSAHMLFLFFVIVIYLGKSGRLSATSWTILQVCIVGASVLNQSATVAVIAVGFLSLCLANLLLRGRLLKVTGTAATTAVIVWVAVTLVNPQGVRFLDIGTAFAQTLSENDVSVFEFANRFGSVRPISTWVGIASPFVGNVIGEGIGSWAVWFLPYMERLGIDPSQVTFFTGQGEAVQLKPYSHFATMTLDLGVVGALLETVLLVCLVTKGCELRRMWQNTIAFAVVAMSLFSILVHSPVSLPVYWITLLLGLELTRLKYSKSYPNAREEPVGE